MGDYKERSGEWKELTMDASVASIPPLTETVDAMLEAMDCPLEGSGSD